MSTAAAAVGRARTILVTGVVAASLLWGTALLLALLLLIRCARWMLPVSQQAASLLQSIAIGAAIFAAAACVWRGRFVWRPERVALWIEERIPELRYALITLVDPASGSADTRARLESMVASVDTSGLAPRGVAKSLVPALIVVLIAGAGSFASRNLGQAAATSESAGASGGGAGTAATMLPSRLENISATLTPPKYTRIGSTTLADPLTIAGLAGTAVIVTGFGPAEGIGAKVGDREVEVRQSAESWAAGFVLPESPAAFILTDRHFSRVVVLEPAPDLAPVVRLLAPAHDVTLLAPTGALTLEAVAEDDIGLATVHFEFIVTSGESEGNISSRVLEQGRRAFGGAKDGRLALTVPYAGFMLREGDVLAVSAVAFDLNERTGPGKGRSETRNIRVARKSEYDELSIAAAPPAFDKTSMSLRMLIIASEKLARQRPRLSRSAFVTQAIELGRHGERIRLTLKTIIDDQRVGGFPGDPQLDVAMNYIWDGVRALNVAEPGEALPPLRMAYDILKKLSSATKYYIRGRTPPVVVNIERVRMSGTEPVDATARKPRVTTQAGREKLRQQYVQAVSALGHDREAALNLFMMMRVAALRDAPEAAEPLRKVVETIHGGGDVNGILLEARRAIEGAPLRNPTLPLWRNPW